MSEFDVLLPGGRGERQGLDAQIEQDESYDVRRRLDPLKDGWFVSTLGENIYTHLSSTPVSTTTNRLSFYYIPDRVRRVLVRTARLNVATAFAGSTCRTAIYLFDFSERYRRLVKISGSEAVFTTTSTGLKTVTLPRDIELPTEAKLFVGVWSSNNGVELEGIASGSAPPRVLRQRVIDSVTPPLGGSYEFPQIPVASLAEGIPFVAYLSPDAAEVF